MGLVPQAPHLRRDLGINVSQATVQVSISSDRRFCWAGKGLYGLYRHGLIPGPRSLAGIARVFLYSHGPLRHASLEFAMKYAGYRFQYVSLNSALNHDPDVFWFNADGGWYWDTARTPEAGEAWLRRLLSWTSSCSGAPKQSRPRSRSVSGDCAETF